MAAPITNFKAAGEDISDIFVDQDSLLENLDRGFVSSNWLTNEGKTALYGKSINGWGPNVAGDLGTNNTIGRSIPVQIDSISQWKHVANGNYHSAIVKSDGTLWAFGSGGAGALGLNNTINRSSPVQVGTLSNWKSVYASVGSFTAAIKTDGTLWAWGWNLDGRLGLNNTVDRSSPVQIGTLTNWAKLALADRHAFAIKTDGTLWAWGWNPDGRLGLNNTVSKSSPTQIGTDKNWKKVVTGNAHALALKTNGTLWFWGANFYGSAGLNSGANSSISSPVQIGSLTDWKDIAAGGTYRRYFIPDSTQQTVGIRHFNTSLGIRTNGTLWAWGFSGNGVSGLNSIIARSSPVQVGSLTDWKSISASSETFMQVRVPATYFTSTVRAAAIKNDGTLWSWGGNPTGALGLNDLINRSSPVQVGSSTNWHSVSTGRVTTLSRNN